MPLFHALEPTNQASTHTTNLQNPSRFGINTSRTDYQSRTVFGPTLTGIWVKNSISQIFSKNFKNPNY